MNIEEQTVIHREATFVDARHTALLNASWAATLELMAGCMDKAAQLTDTDGNYRCCTTCHEVKHLGEFYQVREGGPYRTECKVCMAAAQELYRIQKAAKEGRTYVPRNYRRKLIAAI